MSILIHRSPDPDSIASAAALQAIAQARDVEADIVYEGEIGHQENRAFVNLLRHRTRLAGAVDMDDYDTFALVDTAKGSNRTPRTSTSSSTTTNTTTTTTPGSWTSGRTSRRRRPS